MSGRIELWRFIAQRASAAILAPLVLVHLASIVGAARGGLTAAEILSRTQGSVLWAGGYGLFVIAAAVHGAIGLRAIIGEMTPWRGASLDGAAVLFLLLVLGIGLRAVAAVT